MAGSPTGNTYELVLEASDQASQIVGQVKTSILSLGTSIAATQQQAVVLAQSIAALGAISASQSFGSIVRSVELLQKTLRTPLGKTFVDSVRESANAAISEVQPLSQIISSTAGLTKQFSQGLALGSGENGRTLERVQEQIERLKGVSKSTSNPREKAATDNAVQALQATERELDGSKRFDKISRKITDELVKGFVDIPVDRIPFINKIISKDGLAKAVGPLDQLLADTVVTRFINGKLPGPLKQIASVFGTNLTEGFKGLANNSALASALPNAAKAALGGSALQALEIQLSSTLSRGFNLGFVKAEAGVASLAGNLGSTLANAVANGNAEGFATFDSLFEGRISANISKVAAKIAPKLVEETQVVELVRESVGELTNLISGSLITGLAGANVGGVAGQFLLQLFGDDLAAKAVDKATGGVLVGLGKQLADITQLTTGAKVGFTALFDSIIQLGAKGAIGGVFKALSDGVGTLIPSQVKQGFKFVESVFPEQIAKLKVAVARDIEKVFVGIVDVATLSPAQKLGKEVEKLNAVAAEGAASTAKIQQLRAAALEAATAPDISTDTSTAIVEQINKQIAALQAKVDDAEAAGAEAEALQARIGELEQAPETLRDAAAQTAVSPTLDSQSKNQIIDDLNGQIEAAEAQLQSPLQKLTSKINRFITDNIDLSGGEGAGIQASLAAAFGKADDFLEGGLSSSLSTVGSTAAKSFTTGFGRSLLSNLAPVVDQVDSFVLDIVSRVESIPAQLTKPLESVSQASGFLSGLSEPAEIFGLLQTGAAGVANGLQAIGQQFYFVDNAVQALQQVASKPYEFFIAQNVKLQEQLLATQSTLAATNTIIQGGQKVSDPTQAIQALEGSVESAIGRLRKGSLELVNVTSKDLIDSFQIVAGQSANIGASLDESADLTLSFGAALGTLGVPISQSRQEIQSILAGTIDQNSVVAKSLGITNQQVQTYKQQGVLVEKLSEKLSAFRAGNSLAAQTIGGVTSNIQELVDEFGRIAGEPLLEPIVAQLNELYGFLNENKDEITKFISDAAKGLFSVAQTGIDVLKQLFEATSGIFSQVPTFLIQSLTNAMTALASAVTTTITLIQPIISVFAKIAESSGKVGGFFLQVFLQAKVLQVAVGGLSQGFGLLSNILPGVGELLFLVRGRTLPLLQTFPALSKTLGTGAAGFLLLGQNMQAIPGAAGFVTQALKGFGPLAGIITPLIPSIAGIGVQVTGLASKVPFLDKGIKSLLSSNPGKLAEQFVALAGTQKVLAPFSPLLKNLATDITIASRGMSLAEIATNQFGSATKQAGVQLRGFIASTGVYGIGLLSAFYLVDQLFLKNEEFVSGLKVVGKALEQVGKVLYGFLVNPFTTGIAVTLAVAVAINAGLVPALLKLSKTLILTGAEKFVSSLGLVKDGIQGLSGLIERTTTVNVGSLFDGGKAKAGQAVDEFKAGTDEFKAAIEDRKAKLAKLDEDILRSDPGRARATGVKPVGDIDSLKAQRAAIEQELTGIRNTRKQQGLELSALTKQAADAPTFGAKIRQGVEQVKAIGSIDVGEKIKDIPTIAGKIGDGFSNAGAKAKAAFKSLDPDLVSTIATTGLLTLATLAVGQAIGTYVELTEAATKAVEGYDKSLEGAKSKLEQLQKQNQTYSATTKEGTDREKERLEEIKKSQGFLTKFQEFLIEIANAAIKAVNPFSAIAAISKGIGEIFSGLRASISNVLGGLVDGATKAFPPLKGVVDILSSFGQGVSNTFKPIIEFFDSIVQKVSGFIDFASGLGLVSVAQSQLNGETEGYSNLIGKATKDLDTYRTGLVEVAKDEQKLADLQKRQAELRGKASKTQGEKAEEQRLGVQIKGIQDQIQARKDLADETIKSLESQKAPSDQLGASQALLVKQFKAYRDELDKVKDTKILPPDLPRQGSAIEQLQSKLKAGQDALAKGTGVPDQEIAKIKDAVESAEALQKAGELSPEQAREFYSEIASSSKLTSDISIKAQQAVSASFEQELKKQTDANAASQSTIQTQITSGQIGAAEGEAEITRLKEEQLDVQLANLRAAAEEEDAIRSRNLADTLENLDKQIVEARNTLEKSPNDQGAKKTLESLTSDRQKAQEAADRAGLESREKLANSVATIEQQSATNVAEGNKKQLDTRLSQLNEASSKEQAILEQKVAIGSLTAVEADKQITASKIKSLDDQITALESAAAKEGISQEERSKLLTQVEQKRADKTKAVRDAEQKEIDRTQKLAIDAATKAEAEREIQITKLRQSGKLTKVEADQELAKSSAKTSKAEIDAEEEKLKSLLKNPKRNEDAVRESRLKILQLTKKSLDDEDKLYDAHINVLREKLDQQSKVFANSIEAQNQKLQEQVQIYDLLGQALQQRNQLLNAAKDLGSVTSGFLAAELSILEKGETSDRKKKQLAEATALIKLETAKEQIALENQIAEINEKQRQIALERKKIENEIAISRKAVEIQKSGNDITIAQQDLKKGKITQADFDGKILEQSSKQLEFQQLLKEARLIKQEEALEPLIQQGERQKRQATQRQTIRAAESEFADSAPTAAGRSRRNRALSDEFAQDFGLTRPQLTQELRERTAKAADDRFNGGRKNLPGESGLTGEGDLFGSLNKAGRDLASAANKIESGKAAKFSDVQQDIATRLKQRGGVAVLPDPETKRLQLPDQPQKVDSAAQAMQEFFRQEISKKSGSPGQPEVGGETSDATAPSGGVTFNNNFDVTIAAGTNDKTGVVAMKQAVLQGFDDITRRAQAIATANFKPS